MKDTDAMDVGKRVIRFELNGRRVSCEVASYENLVDLLRRFELFGARESCGQGLCGCCTALLDGVPVSGCLTLALLANGKSVSTVEHLDEGGKLDVVQEAFIDEGAFQCGFCTPGFVLMSKQLLEENPDPNENEIRDYLAGNLCRCATYPEIVKAVTTAARRKRDAAGAITEIAMGERA